MLILSNGNFFYYTRLYDFGLPIWRILMETLGIDEENELQIDLEKDIFLKSFNDLVDDFRSFCADNNLTHGELDSIKKNINELEKIYYIQETVLTLAEGSC